VLGRPKVTEQMPNGMTIKTPVTAGMGGRNTRPTGGNTLRFGWTGISLKAQRRGAHLQWDSLKECAFPSHMRGEWPKREVMRQAMKKTLNPQRTKRHPLV
jgi:hypothetical protein